MTMLEDVVRRQRANKYRLLETTRRGICAYMQDPCDCKYQPVNGRYTSEFTGCCELRDLIEDLTGVRPYNGGQSVEDDVQAILAGLDWPNA